MVLAVEMITFNIKKIEGAPLMCIFKPQRIQCTHNPSRLKKTMLKFTVSTTARKIANVAMDFVFTVIRTWMRRFAVPFWLQKLKPPAPPHTPVTTPAQEAVAKFLQCKPLGATVFLDTTRRREIHRAGSKHRDDRGLQAPPQHRRRGQYKPMWSWLRI